MVAGGLGDWVGGDLEDISESGSESISHLMISFVDRGCGICVSVDELEVV